MKVFFMFSFISMISTCLHSHLQNNDDRRPLVYHNHGQEIIYDARERLHFLNAITEGIIPSPTITDLTLAIKPRSSEEWGALAQKYPNISSVKTILYSPDIDRLNDEDVQKLVQFFPEASKIDLHTNNLSEKSVKYITEAMSNITKLVLDNNYIGDDGAEYIGNSPNMSNLKWLGLRSNNITNKGVKSIVQSEHIKKLECLDLVDNRIGTEGAASIAGSPNMNTARIIQLGLQDYEFLEECEESDTQIGNLGVKWIAKSPYLKNLTYLDVRSSGVGYSGLLAIMVEILKLPRNPTKMLHVPLENLMYFCEREHRFLVEKAEEEVRLQESDLLAP